MSVKMSDVFDLPMQQGDHQRFLLDSNDVYICETEYNNQSEAAKIAINTYDANQEEIKALKEQFATVKYLIDGAYVENSEDNAGLEREWLNKLYRMIDTDDDNQCLADVRADAVDEFIKLVTSKHANALTLTRLAVCAQKLRDNAKC